jgi:uncharacterized protein YxjI
MQYPLHIRFKLLAIASQISVRDAAGNELFYVHQKLLKLKENVLIYGDSTKSRQLFSVKADRVIDFSPEYTLYDADGQPVGSIKRHGMTSLWRARYDITLHGQLFARVREANPLVRVWDGLFGSIPFVGLFSGYVFQPKYVVESSAGEQLAVLEKKPALFEGIFELQAGNNLAEMDQRTQQYAAVLLMIVTLMERTRS